MRSGGAGFERDGRVIYSASERKNLAEKIAAMPAAVWIVVVAGALIVSIGMGVRQTFGLFLSPMAADLGIGGEPFGFARAVQQIMWGAFQPVMGAVADRFGSARVVAIGLAGYVVSLFVM